jgi:hypothetical protein
MSSNRPNETAIYSPICAQSRHSTVLEHRAWYSDAVSALLCTQWKCWRTCEQRYLLKHYSGNSQAVAVPGERGYKVYCSSMCTVLSHQFVVFQCLLQLTLVHLADQLALKSKACSVPMKVVSISWCAS